MQFVALDGSTVVGWADMRVGFEHEARKRNALCFDGVYYDAVQMSMLLV